MKGSEYFLNASTLIPLLTFNIINDVIGQRSLQRLFDPLLFLLLCQEAFHWPVSIIISLSSCIDRAKIICEVVFYLYNHDHFFAQESQAAQLHILMEFLQEAKRNKKEVSLPFTLLYVFPLAFSVESHVELIWKPLLLYITPVLFCVGKIALKCMQLECHTNSASLPFLKLTCGGGVVLLTRETIMAVLKMESLYG